MMFRLGEGLRLLRPHQWVKNAFVFVGLVFGHAWDDLDKVRSVVMAALAFCLVSSAIYVVNDIADRESDRAHPRKRWRPLAAGTVSVQSAGLLAVGCAAAGVMIAHAVSLAVLGIVLGYGALNLAYSWQLKHTPVVDVFVIATGFMLRILAGTVGVDIPPSSWLLLTGLMVTLFLGFAKRRAELAVGQPGGAKTRPGLQGYSVPMLDIMIGVCASGAVLSYSLYSMSRQTIETHGTEKLIYTVPFVLFGITRYLHLTMTEGGGEDPASDLQRDPYLLVTVFGWCAATLWLVQ